MILTTAKGLSVLSPFATNKTTSKTPTEYKKTTKEVDGESKEVSTNLLDSTTQNAVFDKLNLNNIHIKSKELFAISSIFNYKGNEYHTVLQKIGSAFKPVKVYKKENEKLVEVEPFDFEKGKDGKHYSLSDLNKFISSLIFKYKDEEKEYRFNINQEMVDMISQNLAKDDRGNQKIRVTLDNIDEWTKKIQANLNVTDFEAFKKETKTNISKFFSYLSDKELDNISSTFVDLLKDGKFSTIDAQSVTKISLSDIPTLQRISSGQIDENNVEFAERNKMLERFLNGDFEIKKCEAANYLLAGFSNSGIPVFYESKIFNDIDKPKFDTGVKEAKIRLKEFMKGGGITKEKLLNEIKSKGEESELYKYAYLEIIKDGLNSEKQEIKNGFRNTLEMLLKDSDNPAEQRNISLLLSSKKNENANEKTLKAAYASALENSMLITRAKYSSDLEVKLVANGNFIYNSQYGQKLPIEIFYSNHEQIFNFAKNVGLQKSGDSVDTYYGLSLVGFTEVENQNNKLIPIKTHRFYYTPTGFEQIGNIVSNLAKVNEEGNIVYENIDENFDKKVDVYTFDINKNIEKLDKIIHGSKFYNQDTQQPYKSQMHTAEKMSIAVKKLINTEKISVDLASKVRAIKAIIEEDETLQKLKEIGEARKPDYDTVQKFTVASMNVAYLNKFIRQNKDNLLENSPFIKVPKLPKSIKDEDEGISIANKTTNNVILDLERNLRVYSYLQSVHLNNPVETLNNIKTIIEKIKESNPNANFKYDKRFTNDEIKELKSNKKLSMETLLKNITSVLAAKYTQSIPNNIDRMHLELLKNDIYTLTKDDKYSTRYTDEKSLLNVIEKKTNVVYTAIRDIQDNISQVYKDRIENNKANKKPTYGFYYESDITPSQAPTENIENTTTIEPKKSDGKIVVEKFKFNYDTFQNDLIGVEKFKTKKEANQFIVDFNKNNKDDDIIAVLALPTTNTTTVSKTAETNIETTNNINEEKIILDEELVVENLEEVNIVEEIITDEEKIEEVLISEIDSLEISNYETPFDEPIPSVEINIPEELELKNISEEEEKVVEHNETDFDEIFSIPDGDELDMLGDVKLPDALDEISNTGNDIVLDNFGMNETVKYSVSK